MKIDVGGGLVTPDDWVNLDPVHGEKDWKRYAQDIPWPVEDNEVEYIRASHVLEHIPAGQPRLDVFNEAHRVLQPGGKFEVIVPLHPFWQAYADPTHVSFWVPQSFDYFTVDIEAQATYGILPWKKISWHQVSGWEGHWIGTPIKE